jgi:hypothetical protein
MSQDNYDEAKELMKKYSDTFHKYSEQLLDLKRYLEGYVRCLILLLYIIILSEQILYYLI